MQAFQPSLLDALNFLLADFRSAPGPLSQRVLGHQQHWSQTEVGLVTTIGGLLGLAVRTPIGASLSDLVADVILGPLLAHRAGLRRVPTGQLSGADRINAR
jgi:hypothetical protein